jgi:hypothetical protein
LGRCQTSFTAARVPPSRELLSVTLSALG